MTDHDAQQPAEPQSGRLPAAARLPERGSGHWDAAAVEKGLTVLALCSGNTRKAARELEKAGSRIPRTTLRMWATETHAADYSRIEAQVLPTVYGNIAAECEDIARSMVTAERELLERVSDTAGELKPAEAAGALRNLSTAKAINLDKAGVIRGRPTEIREDRTMVEVLRSLERFPGIVKVRTELVDADAAIDGEAVDDESPAHEA